MEWLSIRRPSPLPNNHLLPNTQAVKKVVGQMTKIAHLSSVHRAQDTRILHREGRSLAEAGYQVTVIANADADFEEHGVQVRALPKASGGRISRMTRQVAKVYQMAREERADLYHFHDPELIPVGLLLRIGGKPVIYDVHESVSKQIRSKPWIPKPLRAVVASLYRIMEKVVTPLFSGIVAATPGVAAYFNHLNTVVVQNYPVLSELQISDSDVPREPIVAYVGGIAEVRGAREMVTAMSLLPQDSPIRLILGGPVQGEQLANDLQTLPGSERITLAGILNRQEVADLLSRASVGLVTLHPEPNYLDAYPVKLFEYMAAGLPAVASNFPFWRQFVDDVGSGVMVDPLNPQAIADGILEIVTNPERSRQMGNAGARAVREKFNWDSEAEKLVDLYRGLLGK